MTRGEAASIAGGSVAANPIKQDEINGILWKTCDAFQGTIDPSEYKNYILVMLFLHGKNVVAASTSFMSNDLKRGRPQRQGMGA